VYFLTDPIEMADDEPTAALRRRLYAAFLQAAGQRGVAGLAPLGVTPDEPWLHVMAQPTARGTVHVIYNTKSGPGTAAASIPAAAGKVTLNTRNRWPALAAVTSNGEVVVVNAYGKASIGGETLMEGIGLKALLSLDGNDLRRSIAILVAPFEPGRVEIVNGAERTALVGEFRNGVWTTLERVSLGAGKVRLDLDADRATSLILVCPAAESQRWTDHLTHAMLRPDQIAGY
jgi:hypothetical protein